MTPYLVITNNGNGLNLKNFKSRIHNYIFQSKKSSLIKTLKFMNRHEQYFIK